MKAKKSIKTVMCQKSKIISRVKNGELSICNGCKAYNLVFNNIFFQFDKEQLNTFTKFVSEIDVHYWLQFSACTTQRRKIPVPTFHQSLVLVFDFYEINELKLLLGIQKEIEKPFLTPADIDYSLILN